MSLCTRVTFTGNFPAVVARFWTLTYFLFTVGTVIAYTISFATFITQLGAYAILFIQLAIGAYTNAWFLLARFTFLNRWFGCRNSRFSCCNKRFGRCCRRRFRCCNKRFGCCCRRFGCCNRRQCCCNKRFGRCCRRRFRCCHRSCGREEYTSTGSAQPVKYRRSHSTKPTN